MFSTTIDYHIQIYDVRVSYKKNILTSKKHCLMNIGTMDNIKFRTKQLMWVIDILTMFCFLQTILNFLPYYKNEIMRYTRKHVLFLKVFLNNNFDLLNS